MKYKIIIEMDENNTDIEFQFTDNSGKLTSYAPVIFSIYNLDTDIILYTENKTGEVKNAYSVKNKQLIDVRKIEHIEPVSEIIDYSRF